MYLIDTNVISERLKPKPNENVVRWIESVEVDDQYISVLTLGEIRRGVSLMTEIQKKMRHLLWLEKALPEYFEDRVLSISEEVADCWGRITVGIKGAYSVPDSLLAATAITHGLAVATRDKNFSIFPVDVINPWHFNA